MMARCLLLAAALGVATAAPGQGCYDMSDHTCAKTAATCSPYACTASGKVWNSASAATTCPADKSCANGDMTPGVTAGDAITAMAKAFSDATGADFAAKMAARKVKYTTAPVGGQSLQSLAKGLPSGIADGTALDAYIVGMLDGTQYSAETATWSMYEDGRDEAVKKAVFNQLMSYLTSHFAQQAVTKEAATPGTGLADWDTAWAVYGYLGAASASATPYATANKRCTNYDTCDATRTLQPGTGKDAKTNVAIEAAFASVPSAAALKTINDQIAVTYMQAALRYLNKIDKDVTANPPTEFREHMGEGHSFAQVLVLLEAGIPTEVQTMYTAQPCTVVPVNADAGPCAGPGGLYEGALAVLTPLIPANTEMGKLNEGTVKEDKAAADKAAADAKAAADKAATSSATAATAGFLAVVIGVLAA